MATSERHVKPCLLATFLQLILVVSAQAQDSARQSYIVYFGSRSSAVERIFPSHIERLTTIVGSSTLAKDSLIYSYHNFNAFAAKLTPKQAERFAEQDDVISVFPNRAKRPLTTHSWSFLGLEDNAGAVGPESLWTKSAYGKDVVIGVIDTGIWPESNMFNDEGLGPIPASWKGDCVTTKDFSPRNCNRKLIGARYYIAGFEAAEGPLNTTATGDFVSPRDADGHGSHTSSTAAGNFDPNVEFIGFSPGTAKGGAPMARLSIYKVCWTSLNPSSGGCYDADILAAFDQGISDGVNVYSVSLGSSPPFPELFQNGIAIGSFHAAQFNISTVCAGGNDGPDDATVDNIVPWITTVAASTVDRDFPSEAVLGNGHVLLGQSFSQEKLEDKFYPLISAQDAGLFGANVTESFMCYPGSLDPAKVTGKIVACLRGIIAIMGKGQEVKNAGGAGMILANSQANGNIFGPSPYLLPATMIAYEDTLKLFGYISSTTSPVARITPATTILGITPAPVMASFSSKGPNSLIPDLLKPDIAAPGYEIIAAWSPVQTISQLPEDTRHVQYNIISGTSMATPHVSGITASLKAYHPTWSPAAIRSAIVTTGRFYDNTGKMIQSPSLNVTPDVTTPFNLGGGELNPNVAAEPGLVYDINPSAYYQFLCSLNFNETAIRLITGSAYRCSKPRIPVSDFNYPSIAVSQLGHHMAVRRFVTNVGNPASTYTVSNESPSGIDVVISPSVLKFSTIGEVQSFSVAFKKLKSTGGEYVFGSFTWTDGTYSVRSPLAIKTAT